MENPVAVAAHAPVVGEVHAPAEAAEVQAPVVVPKHHKTQLQHHREVYPGKEMPKDGGLKIVTVHILEMNGSLSTVAGTSLTLKAICLQVG